MKPIFFRLRAVPAVLASLAVAVLTVRAQQGTPPPAPPPSPVIARVESRPITQRDYDQVAEPYFVRLREQLKEGFTEDIRKFAKRNALDELIRREVLAVEAQRQKIVVTEAETDRILRNDPFFFTNGKFDPGKYLQYKISPGSNYTTVLPKIRQIAATAKLDSIVRARSTPSAAAVRAEWSKRNDQVRFTFLPLGLRDVSLEPETTEDEWAAYYQAHPDQFMKKPRVRLRYLRLPLPPAGDSLRSSRESEALARARGIADSLRDGAPIDSIRLSGSEPEDTGFFDVPPVVIPGLGRVAEWVTALAHADSDTTVRVVGPAITNDFVVVGAVTERQPKTLPPLREVLADVRRRADAEKRRTAADEDRHAWYASHVTDYRVPRVRLTRVALDPSKLMVKSPRSEEEQRWYAAHGRELTGTPDSVAQPALDDSLRRLVRQRLHDDARVATAERQLSGMRTGWQSGRDVRTLARGAAAVMETLTVYRDSLADARFPRPLLDSLFTDPARTAGTIEGPRPFSGQVVVWRVDALDTTFVRPFESVRPRVEQAFSQHKRSLDEADGRAHYEAHRADYKTKPKMMVDYVAVKIPPADSVPVSDARIRAHYAAHRQDYQREEEVHARHILIKIDPAEGEARARARADSLRVAIVAGSDFGELARLFSQDPGSSLSGGDLGFFGRGRMVKEFSDTSFALAAGQLSQPVKTQFGFHLIWVEERRPAGLQPLEEVRADIRRQLAQTLGDSTAMRRANALRRRIAGGANPAVAAKSEGGVITAGPFAATEPIPGVGLPQGLAQDFDQLKAGVWAAKVYRAGTSYLLIRPARRIPSGPAAFDEVRNQAIEDAKNAKKKELLAARVAAIRTQLAAGASIDSLAAPYGGLKESGLLTRSSGFVPFIGAEPRLITRAFGMKSGVVSDTLQTAQGFAWIRVDEKTATQGSSFAKDRETIRGEMLQKKYNEWVELKKKTMRIEILRADLREEPQLTKTVTFTPGR